MSQALVPYGEQYQIFPLSIQLLMLHSRVDLRPVTSHDSSASHDPDELASPMNPEPERHRNAFRDILSLRYRPNATPQERIYYLRRLREQRRNLNGEVLENGVDAGASNEDLTDRRRSKRMSVRLSGVFSGRARRERSPTQQGESSRTTAQSQSQLASSPMPNARASEIARPT
jgi:hypothetical protein